MPEPPEVAPYSRLADGYDAVMAHVDYAGWAAHVRALLARHAPDARAVVEIGCGTGSLALALQPLGPRPGGFAMCGLDASADMIRVAERKAARAGAPVAFAVGAFGAPIPGPPPDAVVLVYDGLNYLLREADVAALLARVADALAPGGVFVFDQSTPLNSLRHADGFDDAGTTDAFAYTRTSRYDRARRLHETLFRLDHADGTSTVERHVQRAYSLAEIERLVAASPLEPVAAYDAFSTDPADGESERVHWVARRPS